MGLDLATLEQSLEAIRIFGSRHGPDPHATGPNGGNESSDLMQDLWEDELGLRLLFLPPSAGGMGGDPFDIYRVCESLGSFDLKLGSSMLSLASLQERQAESLDSLMVGALSLGAGWSALERAILHSKELAWGSSTLSKDAGFTHRFVVGQAAGLEAARAVVEATADRLGTEELDDDAQTAVARHMATSAAVTAAEAALQTYSVSDHANASVVAGILRDLQITMRYHGASGATVTTIGTRRWRQHAEEATSSWRAEAGLMEVLADSSPDVGAGPAALALHALRETFETAGRAGSPPPPALVSRLGEMVATAEAAAALCWRAIAAAQGTLPVKADGRIDSDGLALLSRIWARHVALRVGITGVSLFGADTARVGLPAICAVQAGDLDDRDRAADHLFRSTCKRQGRTGATVW